MPAGAILDRTSRTAGVDTVTSMDRLLGALDVATAEVGAAQLRLLDLIAEADLHGGWIDEGARDLAHLLCIRYGISHWKAARWVDAAHALRRLPEIRRALGGGELSIDKAVELSRFASPEDEAVLLRWAEGVSAGAIRRRADREARRDREEVRRAEAARSLTWWYPEPDRFEMQVQTSAADGAQLVAAITERARTLPVLPGEEDGYFQAARYADALVSFCLEAPGGGEAPVPTVVLHATLEALASDDGSCPLEDGGIVHAEAARRLACTAKLQVVLEDGTGTPLAQGGTRRDPSPAMMRALRYRDGECRFSGCGARRFLQAHHIRWRSRAGITVPRNLILLCFFHHKLVHEYGWSLTREPDGIVSWFRPDGTRYRAGPAPP